MEAFGENAGVFGLYELSDEGTILYSRPAGRTDWRSLLRELSAATFSMTLSDATTRPISEGTFVNSLRAAVRSMRFFLITCSNARSFGPRSL